MSQWVIIKEGVIKDNFTALPENYILDGAEYNLRRLWGSGDRDMCHSLGVRIVKEIVPAICDWEQAYTGEWVHTLTSEEPIATMQCRPITEQEYLDKVFSEVTKLRLKIKADALRSMQEILSTINTYDEVGLVALLAETLPVDTLRDSPIYRIVNLYSEARVHLDSCAGVNDKSDLDEIYARLK